MSEKWLPVVGYEGYYEVSDMGRVRGVNREIPMPEGHTRRQPGRILKPSRHTRGGFWHVSLSRGNRKITAKVHRLVLQAFVEPCPPGLIGCHNDGDPSNNKISNLRWDTPSANNFDCVRHGTHALANKTHCPQGHPYDEKNTLIRPHQPRSRRCRICHTRQLAEAEERYRLKRRARKIAS